MFLDYLVFNLPRFRTRMLKIAIIFHKYGFNSKTYNTDTEKYSTILFANFVLNIKLSFYNVLQKNFTENFIFSQHLILL